ncbi:hybrid sensor histidine kinase/response regulator transcription factor [Aestuariibaculum suncheonense]|uniref:histidine kinase n=1 Tax=Aestuariibaculum suncheonense TaxID=1028745 RepID=A0A8J6QBZ8_9FLAO|nr:two-component regulator propeller domain-containing protein [Aestuariibaculum suncheonense]MBD0834768.1 response regulator [Aestuariibaculum suncheonense]
MLRLIILLVVSFFVCNGFSQNEIYKFKHITTAEGLSQTSVIAIQQDDLGQIWFGTRDGLNKYDGSVYTVYKHDREDNNSISNNDILCIEQDSEGFIWVGTYMGLNRYNPKTNVFKTYFANENITSVNDNVIWTIKELSNKKIWIGTPEGLSIYHKSLDTFQTLLKGVFVRSIYETKSGAIYVGSNNGLLQLTEQTDRGIEIKIIEGTEGFIVQDILEDKDNNLLIGTRTNSVLIYNMRTGTVQPYFEPKKLKGKNKNVRELLFDEKGNLWIGTYKGLQIADSSKNILALYSNINDNESISDNFIKALFKDRKGSIWVGTYNGGVNLWDQSNINFINYTEKPGNIGLSFKAVSAIEKFNDLIFFATEGGGISVLNVKNKLFSYINTENTAELKHDNIKSLCLTKDDKLWIGLFRDGLAVYNLKTKKFENYLLTEDLISYMGDFGVYCIRQYNDNEMLIGTFGKGLIKFNLETKSYEVFDVKPNGLTQGYIKAIEVDANNNIWVGTLRGLNVISPNGDIKNYFYDNNQKKGFGITTIYEDSKGIVWVGTDVDGLYKFENNVCEIVELNIANSPVTGIRSIVEDTDNNFWISSFNEGIFKYNARNKKVEVCYTQKEGLVGDQFNNNASFSYGNSQFLFGGPAGVSYFDANKMNKNNYIPQVVITDFKIKNKSVSVNNEEPILSTTVTYSEQLELSHEQGNFSISFSIPNFINSNSNSYKYRLVGLEKDWIETTQNMASYTIQKPGYYTFEVIGVNSDGLENEKPTTLSIRVNPAPWRTWWAFLIYGILVFALLYYLLNILKTKEKLKLQLELEQLEAEQLKNTNKAKLEFFTNISHEFRTPLTLILGPLHQILENYRGSSKIYKKLKVVESSANHLLQLINRLMDFRKYESNLMKLETAEGNIVKFLQEIYLSFSEYAKDGEYDYVFHTSSDEILVYYDRPKLERVFFNLISNAFRYTPKGGKIAIRIIEDNGKINVLVEDSGVGIAEEYHDKIFERFFELSINNKPDNDYNKGTGIGLSIVKNIVDLHKGKIIVRNNKNDKGSVFLVQLLLGRDHLEDSEILHDFKFSEDLSQYENQLKEHQISFEDKEIKKVILEEKPTILLVEDNKPLRKFMRDLLQNDYNILEAENGKIAFKTAINEQIDIIVSDVVMPLMTGTELCSLIKEDIRTSHIPVILLTSRSSLIFKLEGLETGADDYISKPFDVSEFKLRVNNILSSISRLKQKFNSTEVLLPEDILSSSLDEKLYRKALEIVENNISNEEFDIHYFCSELGVSRTVLFKKIKAWTDFSPKEFIQHLRLKKSAQLFEQGKMSISQVSYQVGFKDPKYFSKCFREKYGKTPSDYIKTFSEY